jgi:hypothetical protein
MRGSEEEGDCCLLGCYGCWRGGTEEGDDELLLARFLPSKRRDAASWLLAECQCGRKVVCDEERVTEGVGFFIWLGQIRVQNVSE